MLWRIFGGRKIAARTRHNTILSHLDEEPEGVTHGSKDGLAWYHRRDGPLTLKVCLGIASPAISCIGNGGRPEPSDTPPQTPLPRITIQAPEIPTIYG